MIDGRSGAGKTTLSRSLGEQLGWQVVHLDDFYPGWSGLAEGARMVATDVLHPTAPGFWRWNWQTQARGEWVRLDPTRPLIIEGVGALTHDSLHAASRHGGVFTIYVDCPAEVRKERALRRDPEFATWWDMWAAQEEQLVADAPTPDLTRFCDCSTNIH